VTIVAQKLQQNGLIRYRRGHILIVNPSGLHALACECYDTCKQADALFDQSDFAARKSA
jgi:hypothetical protein